MSHQFFNEGKGLKLFNNNGENNCFMLNLTLSLGFEYITNFFTRKGRVNFNVQGRKELKFVIILMGGKGLLNISFFLEWKGLIVIPKFLQLRKGLNLLILREGRCKFINVYSEEKG